MQCNYHHKAISQCIMMFDNIEILLSYNVLSTQNIFKLLSENDKYNLLTFIKNISTNMESKNSDYVLSCENQKYIYGNKYLKKEDKENLINFFSLFGKSDLNGQIINCKTYKKIFKKRFEFIEMNDKKECKSISTMILGLGFLVIILLF